LDDQGQIIGYQGTVWNTDVKVYSGVIKDGNNNSVSNNVWMSKDYEAQAKQAEAKDKGPKPAKPSRNSVIVAGAQKDKPAPVADGR
jgi:hypothetical protein